MKTSAPEMPPDLMPHKLHGPGVLRAYAMGGVESGQGMLQSGSISVIWSAAELQDFFGVTGHVGEIGVHHGRLFILLCLARNEGERAFAVDVYGNPPGVHEAPSCSQIRATECRICAACRGGSDL